MVRIYTISTCSWCKKVKQYLDEKEVPYECVEIDTLPPLEEEAAVRELMALTGNVAVPVTVIKGEPIVGYSPDEFDKVLNNED